MSVVRRPLPGLLAIVAALGCGAPQPEASAPAPRPAVTPAPDAGVEPEPVAAAGESRPAPAGDSLSPAPPAPAPAPEAPVASAAPRPVRVCAGGDVMVGNNLDSSWTGAARARLGRPVEAIPPPETLVAGLRPLLRDADAVLLNIEGAIGRGEVERKCRPGSRNCYAFRQEPSSVGAFLSVSRGAFVGNVANNHALDAGAEGLAETIRHLERAGGYVTGADTLATPVPVGDADTVAFLGFSTAQAGPDPRDLVAVRRHVARAADRYGRVVVTMHMGAEGAGAQRTRDTTEIFLGEDRGNSVAFARTAVAAGASAVFGHGPHVLRAGEWQGDALVLYSLGNLLTYGPFNLDEPRNRGGMACVVLDPEGGVREAVFRSSRQVRPGVVSPDPTGRGAWLIDSLSALDFPETAVRMSGEAAVLRSDPDPGR